MQVDAVEMARMLANYDVAPFENLTNSRIATLNSKRSAINEIKSAMNDFSQLISSMASSDQALEQKSVTTSSDEFLQITTSQGAESGHFNFFVQEMASAHQLTSVIPGAGDQSATVSATGTLNIDIGGDTFEVDLASLDSGDGTVSYQTIIQAINQHAENDNQLIASVIQTGGQQQLLFSSAQTGVDNQIVITTNSVDADVDSAFATTNMQQLSAAADALVYLGSSDPATAIAITSSSNTIDDVVEGVSITLNQVNQPTDSLTNVVIADDPEATKEKLTEIVDAYNSVISLIGQHTQSGGEDSSRGVLSGSAFKSIESGMRTLFRGEYGGSQLLYAGFEFDRNGSLSIDSETFDTFMNTSAVSVDDMLLGDEGLLSAVEDYIDIYTDYSTGSFKNQLDSIEQQNSRHYDKLDTLERKYQMSYQRYLAQYNQLNKLASSLSNTSSLFTGY